MRFPRGKRNGWGRTRRDSHHFQNIYKRPMESTFCKRSGAGPFKLSSSLQTKNRSELGGKLGVCFGRQAGERRSDWAFYLLG